MLNVNKAAVGKVDEKCLENIIEGVHALNDYSFFFDLCGFERIHNLNKKGVAYYGNT